MYNDPPLPIYSEKYMRGWRLVDIHSLKLQLFNVQFVHPAFDKVYNNQHFM